MRLSKNQISHPKFIKICCNLYFKKKFIPQSDFSTTKYGVQLMPEIKKELDSGEMKHRKHPGVRKMAPIKLPTFVQDAVYRFISNENEKQILKKTQELCQKLNSRRLPVEMSEIEDKIYQTRHELEKADENIPEIYKKSKIHELRKQIQAEVGRWQPFMYDQHECLVYLAAKAASNYASTLRVFYEITNRDPTFKPKTFFDFGSGIGSCMWAANSIWNNSIKEYFCVDSASEMNDLSRNIIEDETSEELFIKPVHYRQFLPASDNIKYDLIVSAFSLMDLSSNKEKLQVIDTLWRKTSDILVIIEQGNLAGFHTVLNARDYILHIENGCPNQIIKETTGAHIICPCPHDAGCPMVEKFKDPCGLSVLYQTIFPRHASRFKKDWISYVVLRKGPRLQNDVTWPRLVKPVLKKAKHVHCKLCCNDGQLHEIVVTKSRHGRHEYRSARSSSLGDLLPVNINVCTKSDEIDTIEEDFSTNYYSDKIEDNKT